MDAGVRSMTVAGAFSTFWVSSLKNSASGSGFTSFGITAEVHSSDFASQLSQYAWFVSVSRAYYRLVSLGCSGLNPGQNTVASSKASPSVSAAAGNKRRLAATSQ